MDIVAQAVLGNIRGAKYNQDDFTLKIEIESIDPEERTELEMSLYIQGWDCINEGLWAEPIGA